MPWLSISLPDQFNVALAALLEGQAMTARRVLLVEDHPAGRATLRLLLHLWGHEVEVATDGLEGVEKALNWKPDVAIVDMGLPRLDGYQLAQQVRAALGPSIRLIALTAYCLPADRQRAFEVGFDHFLSKPADLNQLSRLVAQ